MQITPANPTGLCLCGCGQPVPRATADRLDRGYRKGDFVRYLLGHQVPTGEKNHRWKGGRTVRRGYVLIMRPDHPNADRDGYVPEHRLVCEDRLGRPLARHEDVHHINGDTLDNSPDNLVVLTRKAHARVHSDKLNTWRQTISPVEVRRLARVAGRKGAAARWSQK
jgi:hypothetical protein